MARGRLLTALAVTAAAVAVAMTATAATAEDRTDLVVEDSSRDRPLSSGRRGRIVGGRQVSALDRDNGAEFMGTLYTPGGGMYCGAALIGFGHVLTRAGCYVQTGDIVRVGGVRLFQGVQLKVTRVINHPQYDPNGDLNDIAVLKVSGPGEAAMVAAGVLPITFRRKLGNPHGFFITGYGAVDKLAQTAGSLQLKRGYQPLKKWATCKELLRFVKLSDGRTLPVNEDRQLCTNYQSTRSGALCERDVGGPMYRAAYARVNGKRVKVYVLYGISSYWVGTTSQRCPQGLPNVGTNVSFYYYWIRQNMNFDCAVAAGRERRMCPAGIATCRGYLSAAVTRGLSRVVMS
ncbi:hypothetical protein I4F81_007328 [Pyropia yezoensis]|uniref:Uncharacterized protein n=1 Tax=Pyropia yezoensis TaxID=2788 RepID=A0ACC3C4U7_PYRYE|nr:hypothetical protein I4F81_007328 [Neopyropia yezoensis]